MYSLREVAVPGGLRQHLVVQRLRRHRRLRQGGWTSCGAIWTSIGACPASDWLRTLMNRVDPKLFCPAGLGIEPGFGELSIVACDRCGRIYKCHFQ
jgi:hypothetical protein